VPWEELLPSPFRRRFQSVTLQECRLWYSARWSGRDLPLHPEDDGSPIPILLRHPNNQCLHLAGGSGSSWTSVRRRTSDQSASNARPAASQASRWWPGPGGGSAQARGLRCQTATLLVGLPQPTI
jgi:hypothetical protein